MKHDRCCLRIIFGRKTNTPYNLIIDISRFVKVTMSHNRPNSKIQQHCDFFVRTHSSIDDSFKSASHMMEINILCSLPCCINAHISINNVFIQKQIDNDRPIKIIIYHIYFCFPNVFSCKMVPIIKWEKSSHGLI